jgi:hypothetical protein
MKSESLEYTPSPFFFFLKRAQDVVDKAKEANKMVCVMVRRVIRSRVAY